MIRVNKATMGTRNTVRIKKIPIRSQKLRGMSDSSMALALSVKNMIWEVERTTTKKALAAGIIVPLIKVVD